MKYERRRDGTRPGSFHRSRVALALLALSLAPAWACSNSSPQPQSAKTLGLPQWQGMDRDLFNDEIDPAALGIMPAQSARKDQILWARSQQAEIVGRVRVQTVTVDSRGGDSTYHLGLRFADQLLADTLLEDRDFEVTVDPGDPSYGLVKAQDTGMQGRTFVGFIRRFAGADDEIDVHFFLAPDSAEVAGVVKEAVAVKEVSHR
ncbi:MAG: cobalamin ABC transporter substrate-binding protein [Polyangiaceae bacterium]